MRPGNRFADDATAARAARNNFSRFHLYPCVFPRTVRQSSCLQVLRNDALETVTGLAVQKVVTRKDLIGRMPSKIIVLLVPVSIVRLHKARELSLGFDAWVETAGFECAPEPEVA